MGVYNEHIVGEDCIDDYIRHDFEDMQDIILEGISTESGWTDMGVEQITPKLKTEENKMEFKIIKGKVDRPRRITVYGPPGVGKTSFACQAPKPVMIQTEEGADDIGVDRLPLCTTYKDFLDALLWVYDNPNGYKTLVIDSLNWLEKLIHTEVCTKYDAVSIESTVGRSGQVVKDFGYMAGYGFALDLWDVILGKLDRIQAEKGMTIIMTAHSVVKEFADPTTDNYERYIPALNVNKKGIGAGSLIQQWCDEVLFMNHTVFTKETEKGMSKAVGSGQRVIYTEMRPSFDAKNRLGLPAEIPYVKDNGWSEYAKHLPTPDKKGK